MQFAWAVEGERLGNQKSPMMFSWGLSALIRQEEVIIMKTTKRIISLLLSLLLALLLIVPAAAEDVAAEDTAENNAAESVAESAPESSDAPAGMPNIAADALGDPAYVPIIVTQPRETAAVRVGKTLKLSVEAKLPEAGGKLSYAWYEYNSGRTTFSTDAEMVLPVTKDMLGKDTFPPEDTSPALKEIFNQTELTVPKNHYFYAVVTNTYTDSDGVEQSASVTSAHYSRCAVHQGYFSAIGSHSAFLFKAFNVFALPIIPFYALFYTLLLHPLIWLNAISLNRG